MLSDKITSRIGKVGGVVLRYSLVLFFLGFGFLKFTHQEAAGVAPLMAHSPFLFWVYPLLGVQGGSDLIGVIEIAMGASIAMRHINPLWSAYGSLATSGALIMTVSFLFTTPGLDPNSSDAGFLAKDITLFGAALWSSAEAFAAARQRRVRKSAVGIGEVAPELGG